MEQLGLAHAVSLCRDFVGDEPFCMLLGDNIFQDKMEELFRDFPASSAEAAVTLIEVSDPSRFGIAEIVDGKIKRVIEKPKDPPSNLAISGAYLFKQSIFDAIAKIKPSWRNELEITDAIQQVIDDGYEVHPYTLKAGGSTRASPTRSFRRINWCSANCLTRRRRRTRIRLSAPATFPRA